MRSQDTKALTALLAKHRRFRKYPVLRMLAGPSGTTQQPLASGAAMAGMMLTPNPKATNGKMLEN
jgi:hypothetical protein